MRRTPALLLALALTSLLGAGPAPAPVAPAGPVRLRPMPGPDGKPVPLQAPPGGALAIVFYSSECPISNAYSPTLNKLLGQFPAGKVRLVGACVDIDLDDPGVLAHAKDFALAFPVLSDRAGTLSRKLGAKVTPEAFVLDPAGVIRYHGRIDDQFAGRQKPNAVPVTHELQDALAAVLAGKPIATPYVEAVGCPLPEQPQPTRPSATYAKEISRIIQANCQECHRKGQVGPFALETYEQARKRADDLATVAEARAMPPWKPTPGFGPKLLHDRSLPQPDIDALVAWASAGAPFGKAADLPPPAKFPEGWALGTPDLIVEPFESFSIPADGPDIYRCFVIPTFLPEDVYVTAIEYQPGNRKVVHHMLTYVDTAGAARKKDAADPGPGYSCFAGPEVEVHGDLGGWAPGNEPSRLPDGLGRSLPKGADVVIQVHYNPSGKPEFDRSRIGLHFARKPVKQVLHWSAAVPIDRKTGKLALDLPAGDSNIEVKAGWPVPVDLLAWAVTPHMHLLGRDMRLQITYPDGRTEPLLDIRDWDFAWQNTYYFARPLDLPKGSVLKLVAHFDNSAANPRNPNHPPRPVTWGEATTDEMCIGFLAVTKKGQDLTRPGEKDDLHAILERQRDEGADRRPSPAR